MKHGLAARAIAAVAVLVLFGIALRLLMAILEPILPAVLMRDFLAGWQMLYDIIAPAMPAVFAAAILAAICWALMGWWQR